MYHGTTAVDYMYSCSRALGRIENWYTVLGNVPIIVYGCSFRRDSLFQDVLKRPGTFKNVIKFSRIGQIGPGKNIQVENSLLEAELPIHGVAMRRAFKRYRRTVPA